VGMRTKKKKHGVPVPANGSGGSQKKKKSDPGKRFLSRQARKVLKNDSDIVEKKRAQSQRGGGMVRGPGPVVLRGPLIGKLYFVVKIRKTAGS